MALPGTGIYCVKCDRNHAPSYDCFHQFVREQALTATSQRAAEESPWRWLFEKAKRDHDAAEKQAIAAQASKIRFPFIGIDPAKPGSDHAKAEVWGRVAEGMPLERMRYNLLADKYEPEFRPVLGDDYKVLMEAVSKTLSPCPIADAAFPPAAPSAPAASLPSFDVDHAWDMVVLAARGSRYG
jgi:hypothetical protein